MWDGVIFKDTLKKVDVILSAWSSTIDKRGEGACKAGGATSYVLSLQSNHDNPVSGSHQALSHWNIESGNKYLPYIYLRDGWVGSKAFRTNVNVTG